MFAKMGQITISADDYDENQVFEEVLEIGANDFSTLNNAFIITSDPSSTVDIADTMIQKGYKVISSGVEMIPKNTLKVKGEEEEKLMNLVNLLEEHDDIQNIYSNFELEDAD